MKIVSSILAVSICVILYACKAVNLRNDLNNTFNAITSVFIKEELEKRKKYNPDKEKLQLYIKIITNKEIVEKSKFAMNIDFYNKQNLDGITDSIFLYNGIETYFGEIPMKYKTLFNKEFKYLAGSEKLKPKGNIYTIRDPFSNIVIYFNENDEVEYINPPLDKIYYDLLRDKIKFAPDWQVRE